MLRRQKPCENALSRDQIIITSILDGHSPVEYHYSVEQACKVWIAKDPDQSRVAAAAMRLADDRAHQFLMAALLQRRQSLVEDDEVTAFEQSARDMEFLALDRSEPTPADTDIELQTNFHHVLA